MQSSPLGRHPASVEACAQPWSARQEGYSLIDILMVVALIGVVSAVAVPMTGTAVSSQRFRADAQALTNMVGLAKMRASAGFTRARVRANRDTNTFVLERWDKGTNTWVAEGGAMRLYRGITFGFAGLAVPPPNTQTAIGLSLPCRSGLTAASAAINNTACILFNSRGLPVDGDGALFGGHAIYLTDGALVTATTVTATPRIRRWSSFASAPSWKELQ
jgi:type II secretory pathway pseudopilin PulG